MQRVNRIKRYASNNNLIRLLSVLFSTNNLIACYHWIYYSLLKLARYSLYEALRNFNASESNGRYPIAS